MDRVVFDKIAGIFFLIIGITSVIFFKRFASKTTKFYPKFYQRYYDEDVYKIVFILMGTLFAIIGVLILLGIIEFGK